MTRVMSDGERLRAIMVGVNSNRSAAATDAPSSRARIPALVVAAVVVAGCAKTPACNALAEQGAQWVGGRCVVSGDLSTRTYKSSLLPDHLTVRGHLEVYGCGVRRLPMDLHVEKGIWLYKACVTSLPPDLVVDGAIDSDVGFGGTLLSCAGIPKTARIGGDVRCE